MTDHGHPKDFDDSAKPASSAALVLALIAMGCMTLAGVGLIWNGLWVIGAPMALIFGIWFVQTLIRRPAWRFGGDTRAPGRSRFWETR